MLGGKTGRDPRGTLRRGAGLALAGVATVGVGVSLAQERGGEDPFPNPALTVDVGLGVQVDDDEAALRADLGVGYLTRTRTRTLSFNIGTAVELGEDGLDDDAFLPTAELAYGFDNGTTLLTLSGSYRVQRVDGVSFVLDADPDDFDRVATVDDDGLLETVQVDFGLEVWRRDPVGLELGADVLRRSYRDTSDPDLDDTRRVGVDAALRLTPRTGLDFRLTAARDLEEDDGTLDSETETTRLGGRVTWAATPTTRVDLSLAHSSREETRRAFRIVGGAQQLTGGRETVTNDGLVWTGDLTQDRPNGTRSLGVSRELTDDGSITSFRLGRALDLAGGGSLDLGLGLARFEGGDTVPTVSLAYGTELSRGAEISATLSRGADTDGDDQDIARTRAQIAYGQPLTPASRLGLSAGLARIDVIDGFRPDQTSVRLGASYTRDLTPDWSLSARYDHVASREDGTGTERDNQLSLNLGRSFTFRP